MFYLIFFSLFISGHSSSAQFKEQVKKAILTELKYYPEARLTDIYKNLFQDAYGPGHLIPDTTHAGKYLNLGLQQIIEDTLKYQAIGPFNNYYRINLQLVKDGILPRNVLLEAMVKSAKLARNPNIEIWIKEWYETLEIIENLNLHFTNFAADKKMIDDVLSKGEYVVHHSEHYKNTYKRHYRIIHKSIFQKWKGKYFN